MANQEELKPGVEGVTPLVVATETTKTKNNSVPVDRDQLAQILRDNETFRQQIDQLQSNAVTTQQGMIPATARSKKKESITKLKKWNDKYVVGHQNVGTAKRPVYVYSEYNQVSRESVMFINIILLNEKGVEEKPLKVEYSRFILESVPELVKILEKIEGEPHVLTQGMTYKKDFVENGYGMMETTVQVPMDVTTNRYSYKVLLEDGVTELVVNERVIG